jgi:hypothetical protein
LSVVIVGGILDRPAEEREGNKGKWGSLTRTSGATRLVIGWNSLSCQLVGWVGDLVTWDDQKRDEGGKASPPCPSNFSNSCGLGGGLGRQAGQHSQKNAKANPEQAKPLGKPQSGRKRPGEAHFLFSSSSSFPESEGGYSGISKGLDTARCAVIRREPGWLGFKPVMESSTSTF